MPVHLPGEFDVRVVQIVSMDVGPRKPEQFRQPGASECRKGKQGPERLVRGRDRLLQLARLEHTPAPAVRRLRSFGGQHQRHGIGASPAEPAGGVAVDPVRHTDDDHDRRLRQSFRAQLPDHLGEVIRRDHVEPLELESLE